MIERLETLGAKIDRLPNLTKIVLLKEFHAFLKANGTSDRHQMNSIKAVTAFGHHLAARPPFFGQKEGRNAGFSPSRMRQFVLRCHFEDGIAG
jgi:hypothetical protein